MRQKNRSEGKENMFLEAWAQSGTDIIRFGHFMTSFHLPELVFVSAWEGSTH